MSVSSNETRKNNKHFFLDNQQFQRWRNSSVSSNEHVNNF